MLQQFLRTNNSRHACPMSVVKTLSQSIQFRKGFLQYNSNNTPQ